MNLVFLTKIKPSPSELRTQAGTLYYFGSSNITWADVANLLSQGKFPSRIRGNFAFVWQGKEETIAAVDHLSTWPLFYTKHFLSNVFYELLEITPGARKNEKIEHQIHFLGGHNLSQETTYNEIRRILPGHYLRNGLQTSYINFFDYEGTTPLNNIQFTSLVESEVRRLSTENNALLLSAGTDSTTLAAIIRKLSLDSKFTFAHVHSSVQSMTEKHHVDQIALEMRITVERTQVLFTGDVIPGQSGRQFSFWIENPFSGKKMAVESLGLAKARIFTGEIGDQLFGGPKNSSLLNYALQRPNISSEEIAAIWINLSSSYGRQHGLLPNAKMAEKIKENSHAKEAYLDLLHEISSLFSRMRTKDYLNRILLLNYLMKGPYRTWAYSQDELDWVHPFASWDLFDYAFQLRSSDKISENGTAKWILLQAWRPYLSTLPWRIPKHGFGIPAISKLRTGYPNAHH